MYKVPVHQTRPYWKEFGRKEGNYPHPLPLENPNKIDAGETLYHLGTYKRGSHKKPNPRRRLAKIIPLLHGTEARCMVQRAIALMVRAEGSTLDDWHEVNTAFRAAKYGGSDPANFDYKLAQEALDLMANHVLPSLRKYSEQHIDDADLADAIDRLSKRIVNNVQDIRARTRSTGPVGRPWVSAVDEWVSKRLINPNHLLYCYRHVYGIK